MLELSSFAFGSLVIYKTIKLRAYEFTPPRYIHMFCIGDIYIYYVQLMNEVLLMIQTRFLAAEITSVFIELKCL